MIPGAKSQVEKVMNQVITSQRCQRSSKTLLMNPTERPESKERKSQKEEIGKSGKMTGRRRKSKGKSVKVKVPILMKKMRKVVNSQ